MKGTDKFLNDTVDVSVLFYRFLANLPQGTQIKRDTEQMENFEFEENGYEANTCPICQGPMCEHEYCSQNWCQQDYRCPDCADKEWRAIEAEDEAKYWSHPGWREVFNK